MYANKDNPPPPPKEVLSSGINTDSHLYRLSRMACLLLLIAHARERFNYSCLQYHQYSPGTSPFVTRSRWLDDMNKWTYILDRLERYYFKKTTELTSSAYEQLIRV